MIIYDSFESLPGVLREAVIDLLYRLADDDLLIGHCDSQPIDLAPPPDEAVALASMACDEMHCARDYYRMLHELGESEPSALAFGRTPRQFRSASLVCVPERGWTFIIIRRFLYGVHQSVRLAALSESTLTPLAHLARNFRGTQRDHLSRARSCVLTLGGSGPEDRRKLQEALSFAYPHALGLFEPTEADEPLAQSGICPREEQLRREWESAVAPVLSGAGLTVLDNVNPAYGGRVGKHPETLAQLLDDMRLQHNADPPGTW